MDSIREKTSADDHHTDSSDAETSDSGAEESQVSISYLKWTKTDFTNIKGTETRIE